MAIDGTPNYICRDIVRKNDPRDGAAVYLDDLLQDPRTEGVKIPPVRGPCADFQYFMCIVLPPAGDFLSVAFLYKERVSDGLLFQLVGKVGRRRHVLTEVTRRRQQERDVS